MPEGEDELNDKILAAGRAAVQWARARRATWPDAPPLPLPDLAEPAALPPARSAPAPSGRGGNLTSSLVRWVLRAAASAALVLLALAGAFYLKETLASHRSAVEPAPPTAPAPTPTPTTGGLTVKSAPPGALVVLDGRERGVTPLSLTDLAPGEHSLQLQSPQGTSRRSVTVIAGSTTDIEELIFAGWVAVYAPFELSIAEGSTALTVDERNEIMLPAGPHDLRLTNRTLEFDVVRHVELKSGQVVRLEVQAPRSTLAVTASEPAAVWLDGVHVGDTPLAGWPLDVGAHDLLLRSAAGVERLVPVTVTVKPFAVHVDFPNPGR